MDSGFEIKYRKLFRTYYANLLFYAKRIVGDDDAEDVVQDVFVELWHRKKTKITDEQRRCVKMHQIIFLPSDNSSFSNRLLLLLWPS